MTEWNLTRRLPLARAFEAQVKILRTTLRWEITLLFGGLALLTLGGVVERLQGDRFDYPFEVAILAAVAGLVAPFAIWKGERLFANGHLWRLPVDRPTHAWIKVAGGLGWFWAAILMVLAWLAVLTVLTGGSFDGDGTRQLVGAGTEGDTVVAFTFAVPFWMALVPFGGGLVAYLFSTALVLGVRYPLRWAVVVVLTGLGLLIVTGDIFSERVLQAALVGPLGLDYVISGGVEALETEVQLADGQRATAWESLPMPVGWLRATALWTALGLACVALAAWRHREH